jgi:hypothetical protein
MSLNSYTSSVVRGLNEGSKTSISGGNGSGKTMNLSIENIKFKELTFEDLY